MVAFAMDPDSPVHWWQARLAVALAERCERVVVLAERAAAGPWPANLFVHTVPLWMQRLPARPFGAKWLMLPAISRWCGRHRFDACLVHMAAEWAYRLRPCLARVGVPIALWYAHGAVSRRLRRAHAAADRVLTSTAEGFRLPSRKVSVIGQGVDTELFPLRPAPHAPRDLLVVGRLSPVKRVDLAIETMAELDRRERSGLCLRVIGAAGSRADRRYEEALRARVAQLDLGDRVGFEGARTARAVAEAHRSALVHLHLSRTGSLDKAPLEALSSGCPVLTTSQTFFPLLADFPELRVIGDEPGALAAQIRRVDRDWRAIAPRALRELIVGRHDLPRYVDRVMDELTAMARSRRPSTAPPPGGP
jgi:glycosyltransferase involved in cell wall biosynthesis